MDEDRCSLCGKNIGRASLVRCTQSRCPLIEHKVPVSYMALLGMVVTGLLFLAAASFVLPMLTGRSHGTAQIATQRHLTGSAGGTPRAIAVGGDSGGGGAWLRKLFSDPGPARITNQPVEPDLSLPDVRAATRVQSFSCNGRLSNSQALICTHWDLATADYNLSLQYNAALGRSRNPNGLRRERAAWLAELDRIGNDPQRILDHFAAFEKIIAGA